MPTAHSLWDRILYSGNYEGLWFYLLKDGKFYIGRHPEDLREQEWYAHKGKPWIPAKRQSFISLVKQCFREDDFDDIKKETRHGRQPSQSRG